MAVPGENPYPFGPHRDDSGTYCQICWREGRLVPNDPDHPRSPYCADHRRALANESQARWRRNTARLSEAVERLSDSGLNVVIGKDAVIIDSGSVEVLLGDLEAVLDTLEQLTEYVQHQHDAGQVSGDVLRRWRKAQEDVRHRLQPWSSALSGDRAG